MIIWGDKAQGLEQSTSLKCTCAYNDLNKGKYKVNTTVRKRKRSPDSGIEPETSGLLESVLTFTPLGLLRNILIKLLYIHR